MTGMRMIRNFGNPHLGVCFQHVGGTSEETYTLGVWVVSRHKEALNPKP